MTVPDYGESPNPYKVKAALEEAKAKWTDQGWVVPGNLDLSELGLIKLPLIQKVDGHFWCSFNKLTSLEGCPQSVDGGFSCYNNQLTSLKSCPKKVGGHFYCDCNELTSLKGVPQIIYGSFDCSYNQLISLKGVPQSVGGDFDCGNNNLTSLDGIGKVGGKIASDFDEIDDNDLGFSSNNFYETPNSSTKDIGTEDFCITICSKDGKISIEEESLDEFKNSPDNWIVFKSDEKEFKPKYIELETPRKRLNIARLSDCTLIKDGLFSAFVDKNGNKVDLFIDERNKTGNVDLIVIKGEEK